MGNSTGEELTFMRNLSMAEFGGMNLTDRLTFLYQRELHTSQTLRSAVEVLRANIADADKIVNNNLNNFFLIMNAIIVFIVQVPFN